MRDGCKSIKLIFIILLTPAILLILIMLPFCHRLMMHFNSIDISGGNQCMMVPPAATNIYAKGSHLAFAAEFSITEKEFLAYCKQKGWTVKEIKKPFEIIRYSFFDNPKQKNKTEILIKNGLYYDGSSAKGGIIIAFDRKEKQGYLFYSFN